MKKTQNSDVTVLEKEVTADSQNEGINSDYDDEDDDFSDDEEDSEDEESSSVVISDGTEESLAPFAKVIKTYLESLDDTALKEKMDFTDESYNLCAKHITEEVRKNASRCRSYSMGVLSDAEGYKLMRDYFIDGIYLKEKAEEEEQKKKAAERAGKKAEAQKKADEKKKLEEEKKRQKEEEEKRWKEFLARPSEVSSTMSEIELETLKNKHAKQGEFEF